MSSDLKARVFRKGPFLWLMTVRIVARNSHGSPKRTPRFDAPFQPRLDFTLVYEAMGHTQSGFLTPLCGDIVQMPGLGKTPAGFNVDIDEDGRTIGLF